MGLVLGPACFVATRFGRQPTDPFGKGENDVTIVAAIPLTILGIVSLVFWVSGH